jgi:tape measure domain-containing protein
MSLAEGLKAAVKPAADLLYTLKKIAILTPFTTEDIANTFAFAKTMGVTDAQALLLTNTINDFVAGMGLWPETSQRIIINLEQMVRAGKVTGTELRDLARGAMLPLIDIFASMQKEVNMGGLSLDEFRKKVSAGEVSVNEFFKAFIDVVNKDFKGAAENASVTIEGVVNNFKDLIRSGLGDELFGPLAQRLTVFANSIIRGLLTEESFSALRTVGQSILQTFDYIAKTIQNNVIPVLRSFLLYLGIIKPEVDRAREGFKSFGDRFRDIAKLNNL